MVTETIVNKTHTVDVLEGFHIYKRNGKTIDNSKERNKVSLTAGLVQDRENPNIVKILFFDEQKQKRGDATILFIPGHPDQIRWTLMNTEGPKIQRQGEPKFDETFTIPESIILKRKD